MTTITSILEEKKRLTPSVLMIRLKLKDGEEINFKAGQHIVVNIESNGQILERPLSIASPPHHSTHIELLVKLIQGGVLSTYFENSDIGTEVILSGPKGNFSFNNTSIPTYFIASSTGFAPFRSMIIEELKIHKCTSPLYLVLNASSQEEVILQEELEAIKTEYDNFVYSITVHSNPSSHISAFVSTVNPETKNNYYLCGGPNFVEDIKRALLDKGISKESIYYEEFK